ncbi:MAG: isoaspartyl peptidase/L-asparaginase [Desulfovibrionaceae bacterium]
MAQAPLNGLKAPVILVHGGAYDIPEQAHEAHRQGCKAAAEAGFAVLQAGGSALDAVEAAVRVMEDDPTFDAGFGSFLNSDGDVELDSIIMNGKTLDFGSVAAVQRIKNPVSLARLVMEKSGHCMLAGNGAFRFADKMGIKPCRTQDLLHGRERERWEKARSGEKTTYDEFGNSLENMPSDTVGAVALDTEGNIAGATSTGGTFNKLPGRVGDSPLVGCGCYADNQLGAASSTGLGEAFMKIVACKAACDLAGQGLNAQKAAEATIARLEERTGGKGGLIVLSPNGDIGVAHNCKNIAFAVMSGDKQSLVGIHNNG